MANSVSWQIILKEKVSRPARAVQESFRGVELKAMKLNKTLKETEKRLNKSASRFNKLSDAAKKAALFVSLPATLIGRSMVNAASDAEETASKFNAVFKQMSTEAQKTANVFANDFGVSVFTAKELLSETGDLLTGFDFPVKDSLEMAKTVNVLASELVAFKNIKGGVKEAAQALTSGMIGETEALKRLGIAISQEDAGFRRNLKILMAMEGLTLQQARAKLILKMAFDQSKNAIGATAREWENYASVSRRNMEIIKEIKILFGKVLIPVMTVLAKALEKVLVFLRDLPEPLKQVIVALTAFAAIMAPIVLGVLAMKAAFVVVGAVIGSKVIAAFALLGTALAMLMAKWDEIVSGIKLIWGQFTDWITSGVQVVIDVINGIIDAFNKVARMVGFDGTDFRVPDIKISVDQKLMESSRNQTAPTRSGSGTINGNIVVEATRGSSVISTTSITRARDLNLGVNMVASG